VRIGTGGLSSKDVSIDYTITVPADTEIRATNGFGRSGSEWFEGPANITTGSGDLKISKNFQRRANHRW